MAERREFIEKFLDTNHLMRVYTMQWYRKNFGGIDPWNGQGRILSELKYEQKIAQKDLGLNLGIRPQSLGELLQKLEENGYIKRTRSTIDKRALLVELTDKGRNFQLCKPDYEEVFANLDDVEIDVLGELYEKIFARLIELIKRKDAKLG